MLSFLRPGQGLDWGAAPWCFSDKPYCAIEPLRELSWITVRNHTVTSIGDFSGIC